ncbi:MAG: zinc-binding dehydrogenase [Candidatus Marinimicrobia bacterium]|nr:zinc-binding dehydrogenase [Candidatus Neomarinimicrobiota bacterium]
MKAAILQEPGKFEIETRDIPTPGHFQALIKTGVCGVCTSELDMWTGDAKGLEYPRFIGHEVAGTVVEVGDGVTDITPGDRVAVFAEGRGYAEYITEDIDRLYVLQDDTPFDIALGEPIACSVNGVTKLDPQFNDNIAIVGTGFMGLIMIQLFKIRGAGKIIAIDTRDSMLTLAKNCGATHMLNPTDQDVVSEVKNLTDGVGVDIGIEAAGKQVTLDTAAQLVRMEGKLEIFGFHQGDPRNINLAHWNWMAFQIVNGHSRSSHIYMDGMNTGLQLLEAGKLEMDDLVTHRLPLTEINNAFRMATKKADDFVKSVIVFE